MLSELILSSLSYIERSLEEFESLRTEHPGACPRQPYWDPTLRNNESTRIDFFKSLQKAGILEFRSRIRSKVGIFFVKKKDPSAIRMIIDARITNCHHRSPPTTRLGSGANFGELDLSMDAWNNHLKHSGDKIGWGT